MVSDLIRLWVSKDLKDSLEEVRKNIAFDMKKKYNLKEITIPQSISSQILAAKMQGKGFLNFNIRRISLDKGILEFK